MPNHFHPIIHIQEMDLPKAPPVETYCSMARDLIGVRLYQTSRALRVSAMYEHRVLD